jgi:hypothetical protein
VENTGFIDVWRGKFEHTLCECSLLLPAALGRLLLASLTSHFSPLPTRLGLLASSPHAGKLNFAACNHFQPACNIQYLPACNILFCQPAINICLCVAFYFATVQSIFASVQYSILSACNQYLPACDIRSICQRAIDICQRATSYFASVQSTFASVQYSICQRLINICQRATSHFASMQYSICQRLINICQRATSHFASVQSIFASVQYSILPACNPIFASFHSCLSPPLHTLVILLVHQD